MTSRLLKDSRIIFYSSHTVVIVTKGDGSKTALEVLATAPGKIKDIPKKVNKRCLAFDNLEPNGDEREELLETISIMLACNGYRHYSSSIYTQVESRLRAYGSGRMYTLRQRFSNYGSRPKCGSQGL